MEKYFYLEESMSFEGKYILKVHYDKLPFKTNEVDSYNLMPARILGLEYQNYLRFCRDILGAEIFGKVGIPVAYFNKSDELNMFINLLNKKTELILYNIAHPYSIKKDEKGYWKKILNN